MYVCICNAIKETELRSLARGSAGTAEDLYMCLGRAPQCRQCLDEAEEIVTEARNSCDASACLVN